MINVTKDSSNIFKDLGFETQEAINLKICADLMLDLRQFVRLRDGYKRKQPCFWAKPKLVSLT
jgi:hypothetical protein